MSINALTGTRVVVRPPNVPTPPPISLLTQNNVVENDADVIGDAAAGRWEAGGGVTWWSPLSGLLGPRSWQEWPDSGGSESGVKRVDPSDFPSEVGPTSPIQRPIIATALVDGGVLAEWALRNQPEGSIETQLANLLGALLPRVIQTELWSSAIADGEAGWDDQCRLKAATTEVVSTGALPFARALAVAEGVGANFVDRFGGAWVHMSPTLFSQYATFSNNLVRSPSGRSVQTVAGAVLIPEFAGDATGIWGETSAGTTSLADRNIHSLEGDDINDGWLFVTPPVRVRLGQGGVRQLSAYDLQSLANAFVNDEVFLVERAFTIEWFNDADTTNAYAIPVDYTQEF